MSIDKASIGKTIGPIFRDYTWKDAALYALSVGAGFGELEYCYEKKLKILPTFTMASIFDMFFMSARQAGANLQGILHGEQDLIFHSHVPENGRITTTGKITNIYDKGKDRGALIIAETETLHSETGRLMTGQLKIFSRFDGGFGGQDAPKSTFIFPDNQPDVSVDSRPAKDQPLLYRLTGDFFELHVDPEFAERSGFEKPIMHGMCTMGFACLALIQSLIPSKPENVRRISCRFSKFLYPGTPIQTQIWKTEKGRAVWKTINPVNGDIIINNGLFEYEA